ncbi:MAG: ArnT family glycosyltransferase [Gammaproteobacteria bacterium]
MQSWAEALWGKKSQFIYLFIAASVLLFTLLGSRDIWTQEHRWADIVTGMFFRHDFLHPYLNDVNYYDKPLLSYWLIAAISYINGHVSAWALRLPSALAGLLGIWSIYRLGTVLKDKRLGLLSGWMLLTAFYFIFWARTSSADMLNMAGSLFAVCWYFEKKNMPSFFNYMIFFLILALTCLCKGLVGAIVPLIAIFPDLMVKGEWKKHLRLSILPAMIPAALVYVFPFWASTHFGGENYGQSGLYLVYRENIMRYFQPFDHKGPIYTYFIFLPVYLLPWAFFFIPTLFSIKSRWQQLSANSKWLIWVVLLLFVFFTLSGSRRNYYILPLVPFAILMTADWILAQTDQLTRRNMWAGRVAVTFFLLLFLGIDLAQPLFYANGGTQGFATQVKAEATKIKPWADWQFVLLDPESKTRFYLQLPPQLKNYDIKGSSRHHQTAASLIKEWPMLQNKSSDVIYVTRKIYTPMLKNILTNYDVLESSPTIGERLFHIKNENAPVAFIPKRLQV